MNYYNEFKCEDIFTNKEIVYCIFTNTIMSLEEKKINHEIGPDQIFIKH